MALRSRYFDFSHIAFIAGNVLLQGEQQALGMFRGQDHTTLDFGLRHTGKDRRKVDDKFRNRMRDDRQIDVITLSYVLAQIYLHFLILCHSIEFLTCMDKIIHFSIPLPTREGKVMENLSTL